MSRVQQLREKRGLRRNALALMAGISYEYLRRIEERTPPSIGLDTARRIARALEVTVDDLFPPAERRRKLAASKS